MSEKLIDYNATPLDDDGSGLRGGTQGGGLPIKPVGDVASHDTGSPSGSTHLEGTMQDPPDRDVAAEGQRDPRQVGRAKDPQTERAFGGRTGPSPAVAAQQARDEADIPPEVSHPGRDEGDPRQIPPDLPNP